MGEIGSGNNSSYPGALDTNSIPEVNSPAAGKTKARKEPIEDLTDAVIKIETELGTDPAGSLTDVKTFLQTHHQTDGTHKSTHGPHKWLDEQDYANFTAAVAAAANKTLVVARSINLDANTTIPASVSLMPINPGIINANGFTLTINAPVVGNPMHQWLSGFAAGDVTFGVGAVDKVYVAWTGAVPVTYANLASITDSTTAFQVAIDSIKAIGGIVQAGTGLYKLTTNALKIEKSGITLQGNGIASVLPNGNSYGVEGTCFLWFGTSGIAIKINKDIATDVWTGGYAVPYATLQNFSLLSMGNGTTSPNVQSSDTGIGIKKVSRQSTFKNLVVGGFKRGIDSYESIIDVIENVEYDDIVSNGKYPCDIGLYLNSYHHGTIIKNNGWHWNRIGMVAMNAGFYRVEGGACEQMTGGGIWGTTDAAGFRFGRSVAGEHTVWITGLHTEECGGHHIYVGDSALGTSIVTAYVDKCRLLDVGDKLIYADYGAVKVGKNAYGGGTSFKVTASANGEIFQEPSGYRHITHSMRIPASIAGDTFEYSFFATGESPDFYNAEILDFGVLPDAAMTGDATNYCTLQFVNKGNDGLANTVVAELAFTAGVNLVAYDQKQIGATSFTLSGGYILSFKKTIANAGLATPTMQVYVVVRDYNQANSF